MLSRITAKGSVDFYYHPRQRDFRTPVVERCLGVTKKKLGMCGVSQAGVPAVREWKTTESEERVFGVICLSEFINYHLS